MKIVILHQTITKYDAIGNDILHMYDLLNKNHECFVYCEFLSNEELTPLSNNKLMDLIIDKNNLIIYHHSLYWDYGEEILKSAKAKIIFKYHNITPSCFFKRYNDDYTYKCSLGREQTLRLCNIYKDALWIGDSLYNLRDIGMDILTNKAVLPPFNNVENWNNIIPDNGILKNLIEGDHINLLFVGRIAPNKGHKLLIEVVKDYVITYGNNIHLNIIGKMDKGLELYNNELINLIEYYDLEEYISFIGEINDITLISYYLGSDIFLCFSDHEGFCVPIIEAQYLRLPIIAKKISSVQETLGENQLLLDGDIREYSSAIKVLSEITDFKDYLVLKGTENYQERFRNIKLEETFKNIIEDFTGVKV